MISASPLSPPACQQVISALSIIMGEDGTDIGATKVRALSENGNYFRYKAKQMGLDVLGDWGSPICPIVIYHPGRVCAFSREMLAHKVYHLILCRLIIPPRAGTYLYCIVLWIIGSSGGGRLSSNTIVIKSIAILYKCSSYTC
jgi:serine palmitoyltransferase